MLLTLVVTGFALLAFSTFHRCHCSFWYFFSGIVYFFYQYLSHPSYLLKMMSSRYTSYSSQHQGAMWSANRSIASLIRANPVTRYLILPAIVQSVLLVDGARARLSLSLTPPSPPPEPLTNLVNMFARDRNSYLLRCSLFFIKIFSISL